MTIDEAIRIVQSKARGRTRYRGQREFLDEVLVQEILRLRQEIDNIEESEHQRIRMEIGE